MNTTITTLPTQCDFCGSTIYQTRYRLDNIAVVECEGCGLVFVTSREGNHNIVLQDIYSSDYFLERDEYFSPDASEKQNRAKQQELLQDFQIGLDLIKGFKKSGRLLDVGCATGTFLKLAQSQGWEVCGTDISEFAVSRIKELYNIEAYAGNLSEIHFPEEAFDVITMWDVVEHFISPSAQLKETHRILKDDGILLLNTPNEGALIRKLSQYLYQFSRGIIDYPAKKLHHIFHLYYFSEKTLQQMLEASGFEIVELVGKPIPFLRGRGSFLEKSIVRFFSYIEKILNKEYELIAIAKKR